MRKDINQHLQMALAEVQEHPEHWLLPIRRRALYDILDPDKSIPIYLQIRPWLDLYTTQKVLHLWEPIIQDPQRIWEGYFDAPAQVISFMEGILNNSIDREFVSDFVSHWIEVSTTTGELPSSQFHCAWHVFDTALKGLIYILDEDDLFCKGNYFKYYTETSTEITDFTYSDAANFAAIAASGGEWKPEIPLHEDIIRLAGVWNTNLDSVRTRRLNFWRWWLLEAIPKAYEQTQNLQPHK